MANQIFKQSFDLILIPVFCVTTSIDKQTTNTKWVHELVRVLYLLVVTISKCEKKNQVTNPKPVYSHCITCRRFLHTFHSHHVYLMTIHYINIIAQFHRISTLPTVQSCWVWVSRRVMSFGKWCRVVSYIPESNTLKWIFLFVKRWNWFADWNIGNSHCNLDVLSVDSNNNNSHIRRHKNKIASLYLLYIHNFWP